MKEIKGHSKKTWYILTPANHHGFVEVGGVLSSGQEVLETFTKEKDYLAKLEELNIVK